MHVLNSAIPPLCIKSREYKNRDHQFLLICPNIQNFLKNKGKILNSASIASRNFMRKLIPHV